MHILVTGACGWTASAIIQALAEAGHEVIGFDLPTAVCAPDVRTHLSALHRGDIGRLEDVAAACAGCDAVIHLAVAIGEDDYAQAERPFHTNVKGTYQLFTAARQQNVMCVILMSSAPVHLIDQLQEPVTADAPLPTSAKSDHLYDLTKRLQEEIARNFCETFGMSAVVLRAGHIVAGRADVDPHGRPLEELTYCRGGWVCRYDLAQACVQALSVSTSGYRAFHIVGSHTAYALFDVGRAEEQLGLTFTARFDAYT